MHPACNLWNYFSDEHDIESRPGLHQENEFENMQVSAIVQPYPDREVDSSSNSDLGKADALIGVVTI